MDTDIQRINSFFTRGVAPKFHSYWRGAEEVWRHVGSSTSHFKVLCFLFWWFRWFVLVFDGIDEEEIAVWWVEGFFDIFITKFVIVVDDAPIRLEIFLAFCCTHWNVYYYVPHSWFYEAAHHLAKNGCYEICWYHCKIMVNGALSTLCI